MDPVLGYGRRAGCAICLFASEGLAEMEPATVRQVLGEGDLAQPDLGRVRPTPGRTDVVVRCSDGRAFAGPIGTPLADFVRLAVAEQHQTDAPVAALVNGRLCELTHLLTADAQVDILHMSHRDGSRIYRRSLTLLLLAAVQRCFPQADISVEHVLDFGAYYCTVSGREPFNRAELAQIEAEMRTLVEANLPIIKRRVPLEEALALFERSGDASKVELLAHRRKDDLAIYTLDQVQNYFHGYMVPSSGYLRWFGLAPYGSGFALRFPRRDAPGQLQSVDTDQSLVSIFREYGDWMHNMKLRNLGSLNNAVTDKRILELILISEALHERRIAAIAATIAQTWQPRPAADSQRDRVRVVFVAGPSSSGKTTFAKRIGIQLLANGIQPYALSIDDFFVARNRTPLGDDGRPDYESVDALDLSLFHTCLRGLLAGAEVTLPAYDFRTGRSLVGETVCLDPDQVLIVEGIHGLNPRLTSSVDSARAFQIYVSVLTHLNLDRHNRIPPSDVRLLRRIVRDHRHRGYSSADTLTMWERVRQGEENYILPFMIHADAIFNSALLYELAVLCPLAEPLLLQVDWDLPQHSEARRLLAFLQWVRPSGAEHVPNNSIIREFIGGSSLRHFNLLRE